MCSLWEEGFAVSCSSGSSECLSSGGSHHKQLGLICRCAEYIHTFKAFSLHESDSANSSNKPLLAQFDNSLDGFLPFSFFFFFLSLSLSLCHEAKTNMSEFLPSCA